MFLSCTLFLYIHFLLENLLVSCASFRSVFLVPFFFRHHFSSFMPPFLRAPCPFSSYVPFFSLAIPFFFQHIFPSCTCAVFLIRTFFSSRALFFVSYLSLRVPIFFRFPSFFGRCAHFLRIRLFLLYIGPFSLLVCVREAIFFPRVTEALVHRLDQPGCFAVEMENYSLAAVGVCGLL